MRHTPIRVGLVLLLAMACPSSRGTASAQNQPGPAAAPQNAPPVRASLLRLDALLTSLRIEAPAVATARDRAHATLRSLLELSTTWPADSPAPYRRSLATLVTTVEQAARDAGPSLLTVLGELAEDLGAKLDHCRASGGKLGGAVNVRVRTVQGGSEAPHWQVFYMPKILEVSPVATADLFPTLSSPTLERLVPGRYLMWAREPTSGRQGDRVVLKVGDGRAELDVDLPVPAQP